MHASETDVSQARPVPIQDRRWTILSDLREVVRELVSSRELLYQLAKRDIKVRYKQAVMGFAWALFMPVVIVLAGLIIRMALASVGGQALDVAGAGAMAVKGISWSFFVGAIGFATNSLTANVGLVTKIYFPREVLPLSSVMAQAFDTAIAGTVLTLALPFLGAVLSPNIIWVPVLLALLVVMTTAAGLFLACANLFFRDVKYIVQVLLTFGIFFTPVLFEASVFGERGASIIMLNPLSPILEGLRLSLFTGHSLLTPLVETTLSGADVLTWQPWYLAYSATWALGGLFLSTLLFHRAEFAFAEYV